jgi:hypothetical protein
MLYFTANLFEEITADNNRYTNINKILYNVNMQSVKIPTLSQLEFCKEVIEESVYVYSVYNATALLFLTSTHLTHDMFRPTWPSSGVLNCPNCNTAFNSVQFTLPILL